MAGLMPLLASLGSQLAAAQGGMPSHPMPVPGVDPPQAPVVELLEDEDKEAEGEKRGQKRKGPEQ